MSGIRPAHGWTPGQHALLRALAGLALAIQLWMDWRGDAVLAWAALAGLFYALGFWETLFSALLALCLFFDGGLQDPWALGLAAILVARAPPTRGLRLGPAPLYPLMLFALAAALAASGALHVRDGATPLAFAEFALLPLLAFRRTRPWAWAALLATESWSGLRGLDHGIAATPPLLLAFAFEPAWIRARLPAQPHVVFYDGACGFCHASVRLLLREDAAGEAFRFAPLQGARFAREVPPERRAGLPDSIVLRTADGRLLTRFAALLEMGAALGGLWRLLAGAGRALPRSCGDALYDCVARIRDRLFRKPSGLCPLLPPQWIRRFDLDE